MHNANPQAASVAALPPSVRPGDDGAPDWREYEQARMTALDSYNLLDSPREEIYDDITELAAQICGAAHALINLANGPRQWQKSSYHAEGAGRLLAQGNFCNRVVVDGAPLEVSDAAHDVRFFADPLVLGGTHIRFYAGMPLMTSSGEVIGTLCVFDPRPKTLTTMQRAALSHFTDVVMRLFEARRIEGDAERLGLIVENSLNEIVIFDALTNRVLHANLGARRNLGYSLGEMKSLTALDLSTDWNDERRQDVQRRLRAGDVSFVTIEATARRKDGSTYPIESRVQFTNQYGRPAFALIGNDVSARRAAEDALHREQELAQITLASIGDAMLTTDVDGKLTYLNPVAEKLTGWSIFEAVGRNVDEVFKLVSEVDRLRVESPVDRVLSSGQTTGLANNTVLLTKDGGECAVEDSAAPIKDRVGKMVGVVLVFRDVTKARELAHNLTWAASHDALTDLINRREFEHQLGGLLTSARNRNLEHAILYIDLDQFKIVNDTCGHQAGDELLKQLSAVLVGKMRRSDTLARLGGDEFGALLEGCDIVRAKQIAEQLQDTIRAFRFAWRDRRFSVSASIGVAAISAQSESVQALMSAADTACFMAKDKGRNQVQVFYSEDEEVTSRHDEMSWASRLVRCLDDDRFFLVLQAADHLSGLDDDRRYIEVLLRMRDEQGKVTPPMAFIPAAERYQLMPRIDRWVVKRLLHCLAKHRAGHPSSLEATLCAESRFAINISGLSLSDPNFLDFVLGEFDGSGTPGSQICFEITETAAISNLARARRFMSQLKALGCRFALDDFGSGLSSFAYLKNLAVDYLKIDGMFVRGTANDDIDLAMVESINNIGHVMGMRTIAECVENSRILAKMRAIGVDHVQGNWVHQPEVFAALVARGALKLDGARLAQTG